MSLETAPSRTRIATREFVQEQLSATITAPIGIEEGEFTKGMNDIAAQKFSEQVAQWDDLTEHEVMQLLSSKYLIQNGPNPAAIEHDDQGQERTVCERDRLYDKVFMTAIVDRNDEAKEVTIDVNDATPSVIREKSLNAAFVKQFGIRLPFVPEVESGIHYTEHSLVSGGSAVAVHDEKQSPEPLTVTEGRTLFLGDTDQVLSSPLAQTLMMGNCDGRLSQTTLKELNEEIKFFIRRADENTPVEGMSDEFNTAATNMVFPAILSLDGKTDVAHTGTTYGEELVIRHNVIGQLENAVELPPFLKGEDQKEKQKLVIPHDEAMEMVEEKRRQTASAESASTKALSSGDRDIVNEFIENMGQPVHLPVKESEENYWSIATRIDGEKFDELRAYPFFADSQKSLQVLRQITVDLTGISEEYLIGMEPNIMRPTNKTPVAELKTFPFAVQKPQRDGKDFGGLNGFSHGYAHGEHDESNFAAIAESQRQSLEVS